MLRLRDEGSTRHTVSARALEGQVALITGAAKRIGRAIAEKLAGAGAAVAVHYRTSRKEAEELVQQITAAGGRALAVQGDVSKTADVEAIFSAVDKHFGRLDALVNNAGVFAAVPVDQLTEAQWDSMMDANLKSQFLCAQAAARRMKRQGRGRIVNLASVGGLMAWPKYAHYCVSKAGVIMLTRCLAKALAPEITVNAVAPGVVQFPGEPPEEVFLRKTPLGRAGRAEEIADAVLFLLMSDYITGQVLVVDGGRTLN